MPAQDTSEIKEKILFILRKRGPSLPVHIAGETGLSILFSSAFLSELLSEKKIKISNMKVGSSPIYFIPGQEPMLEKFSQHLKSKEKDAFMFLKQKKFLKDKEQEPAIRVALRVIKDFAIPFKKNEEIFWRYFSVPEIEFAPLITKKQELKEKEYPLTEIKQKIVAKPDLISEQSERKIKEKADTLDIFDKQIKKKQLRKKVSQRQNEKFFNKVKEFLSKKSIEISDIESFSKKDLTLRIIKEGKEFLLIAYNKKRINENDLIKAYKKASELNLQYIIISLGEQSKKLDNFIKAIRNLEDVKKIK